MNRIYPVILALLLSTGCGAASTPTQPSTDPNDTIKAIQHQAGLPDLPVQFVGMAPMPDSPGGDLQVAVYRDSAGRKFSLEATSALVLQIDSQEVTSPPTSNAVLSAAELKAKAEALARAATPGFDKLKGSLTYNTGTQGDVYFFTWRTTEQGQWYKPPFIQVALKVSGDLVGYVNTVILPE